MKNFIIGLLLGGILVIGCIWYYGRNTSHADKVKEDLQNAATHTREIVEEKLGTSNLTSENIKEELRQTGKVVREKVHDAGAVVADATADARITTVIKAKLLRDSELSSLSISVTTTGGHVTLSGTAASPEKIRKAIQLAMDTEGVTVVVSTLQVKN